ncbi:hypothetical protein KFE25_002270 [Diacronema lutheri]|mgnify:CR=1 FL=1|uniref:Prolyl 4-hydroxylase alpha subunit domain-containing protein n=1 Tax=Diacronema lutheri TaxID=2081491 RepID=A0A8J5X3S3_DIALT|nr:hypothetical protein KFE25_002270 [Diacronema lutheri]
MAALATLIATLVVVLSSRPQRPRQSGRNASARSAAQESTPLRAAQLARAAPPGADRVDERAREDYARYLELSATPLHVVSDERAQASEVVALEGLLTEADVHHILELAERTATSDPTAVFDRSSWSGAHARDPHWRVTFLQANHVLQRKLPEIARKLTAAVRAVDAAQRWNATSGIKTAHLGIRCAEVHAQTRGGGLPDPEHRDHGSLVTVDVMLSDAGAFEGGHFSTFDAAGARVRHEFGRGTALVFLSLKRHGVTPVLSGRRQVLVLEFWQGAEVDVAGRDESQRWFGLEARGRSALYAAPAV